ncbi:hypothetical protein Tco_1232567 [Tanacetum coccineum]
MFLQSSDTEVVCTKGDDGEVMFIELIRKNDDSSEGEPEEEGSTTTEGVRKYQKSHENNQKRASTDTRIRRVQKEAKESKPKPESQASVKSSQRKVNHGQ